MKKADGPNGDRRYWWFKRNKSLPVFFHYYTSQQKQVLCEWYDETDTSGSGECNYPLIGLFIGLIGSNPSSRMKMVQLGHYNGFSSLLLGFVFQNFNISNSFISFDISSNITAQANKWTERAGLNPYVKQLVGDSADPQNVNIALDHLQSDSIDILFIDSSHEYNHTLKELQLWFPKLSRGGFVFLHDTSLKARQANGIGVHDAFKEFCDAYKDSIQHININSFVQKGISKAELLYQDGCGVGILQKIV
jgi:predicted O-methyltransferase YrrM